MGGAGGSGSFREGSWAAGTAVSACVGRVVVGGRLGALGFVFRRVLGFVRAFRERVLAQLAQLLEAAADLAALLRLVAAHGVEALEVEGGERVGLLPLEAGLRRAELGRGVEQGDLDPLGPLALPEGDGEAAREPGLDLAHGRRPRP